jgi:hypothetical protein
MKRAIVLALALGLLGRSAVLFAQFKPEEVADFPHWEEFLREASVIAERQMTEHEGVTRPRALTLEKDGVRRLAIWKGLLGLSRGYLESWRTEIAAYRLSADLGLNMVPPAVEREYRGRAGCCVLGVDYWLDFDQVCAKKLNPAGIKVNLFFKAICLQRAFDNLIANEDRHRRNFLITEDWRMILIDHSRSFRTSSEFTRHLIYDEHNRENKNFIMATLPRAFVEKLRALDFDGIRAVVGDYLSDQEIRAVLARRDLIIAWIEKRIQDVGEAPVLY